MQRLVIVGGGMAAGRLLEELHARAAGKYAITVLAAEPGGIYNRIQLSAVLAGSSTAEQIVTHPPDWFAARGIDFRPATSVNAISRAARQLVTDRGTLAYDRLVLAVGSQPIVLPVPGHDLPGVVAFRSMADIGRMLSLVADGGRVVVIGGGLLGLEAAAGLAGRGCDVTVVHLMTHLMERQLDSAAASLLCGELRRRGIEMLLGAETSAILGTDRAQGVALADGRALPADLVVMAVGVRPDVELARRAGLEVGRGILVDDALLTGDPAISALGECIEHRGRTFGLVTPIWQQATVLARRLAGEVGARYGGSVLATSLKVSGTELYSAGDHLGEPGCETIVLHDRAGGYYRKLVLRDDRLAGAVLYGDATDGAWYLELIGSGVPIGAMREALVFGRRHAEMPARPRPAPLAHGALHATP